GSRRFTGSHEAGSFDPDRMPTVSWINDRAPASTDAAAWRLDVLGDRVDVADLAARSRPVTATLDCTGGWWSTQAWDAVPLRELIADRSARSIKVASATGYSRLFPFGDVDDLYLAVGYGGQPLRRGHGAPVRLVAPGRRGPWWIKWVTSVQLDDRPWWFQTPFPFE
ncbi:MAG TPA: molybdopterin-dependent oxidoreductase, partial [Acidimicrobiales bacterium]|nr:molybdopterin-dependent oxidoreductase [Acidimicrobiales bacterium]